MIDENGLERKIEVLPGKDLLAAISATVNRRLPGYNFDPNRESFILRGENLIFYPEPPSSVTEARNLFFIHQEIGTVKEGATVIGKWGG